MTDTNTANPYQAPSNPAEGELNDAKDYSPKLFALSGRIGRLRYLAYAFVYTLVFMLLAGIGAALMAPSLEGGAAGIPVIPSIVLGLSGLLFVVMIISLGRRRLNDLDNSGWWLLLNFIPIVGFFFGLYMLLWPGTKGVNNFGVRPKPNSWAMIILALLLPVLVGVMAAISIPAYQDYVQRAEAAQSY